MKTEAKGGAAPSWPPPRPPFEELERLTATGASPSLSAAWWVTQQVSETAFAEAARHDLRSGDSLPLPLTDLLTSLRAATSTGRRPFPHDGLFIAARFAFAPLAHLLEHHRHRVIRTHQQLPFHRLREVDSRSLAWLARQPGRSVREKLAGRTHALGVQRELVSDTSENRLLKSFAKLVAQRAGERLSRAIDYDQGGANDDRVAQLAEVVSLCSERFRRSELDELPAPARVRPNNVLLSDPLYSRVFRAWTWLREEEDAFQRAWPDALTRARSLSFWMVAARLAGAVGVTVSETLGRVVLGRSEESGVGIEVLGEAQGQPAWLLNPPLHFLIGPLQVRRLLRLSLDGDSLLVKLTPLTGNGVLVEGEAVGLRLEVKAEADRIEPGRGVAISVGGVGKAFADLSGLAPIADLIARKVILACEVREVQQRPPHPPHAVGESERIGLELGGAMIRASCGRLAARAWSAAVELPGRHGVEWLDGRADRQLALGQNQPAVLALGDLLDPPADQDSAAASQSARRILQGVADELRVGPGVRVGYTVPDSIDEFSQRAIRGAVGAAFSRADPIWRSIAGAIAWSSSPTFQRNGAVEGDHVVVVDAEFAGATATLLVARRNAALAAKFPSSRGLSWERKPLEPSERLEDLGWPSVLHAYARHLVNREDLARDLVRTGIMRGLVEHRGSAFVELRDAGKNVAVLKLTHDQTHFQTQTGCWLDELGDVVVQDHDVVPRAPNGKRTHVLLIGGPHQPPSLERLRTRARDQRAPLNFVTVPSSDLAAAARECLLRIEAGCVPWTEWLPELSLEVVRDGHYGALTLLGKGTIVNPFLGRELVFEVPEQLTLGRGKQWYSFPLSIGHQGARARSWEARLESPAFPLAQDVRGGLKLAYKYGVDTSFRLLVEPASRTDAPFSQVEARWEQTSAITTAAARTPPAFPVRPWIPSIAAKFVTEAKSVADLGEPGIQGFLPALARDCWSQGRCVETAPDGVRQIFTRYRDRLLQIVSDAPLDPQNVPRATQLLASLHVDAPATVGDSILELEAAATDLPSYRTAVNLLCMIVGDGAGPRQRFLERLLGGLNQSGRASATMDAIARAAWRHPNFIGALAAFPGAVASLLMQCERSLRDLCRMPDPDAWRSRGTSELLLALLRLGHDSEGTARLRRGSASASQIAKSVRQLDARFAATKTDLKWRIRLDVKVPEELHRMSPVAFVMNSQLLEGAGTNLVQITAADSD